MEDDDLPLESWPLPPATDPDNAVILNLEEIGSDVSKPHLVEFFLYFPERNAAEQAAARIQDKGFQVEVSAHPDSGDWRVLAAKAMLPEPVSIQRIRSDFTVLAASLNGEYDGWETGIVK